MSQPTWIDVVVLVWDIRIYSFSKSYVRFSLVSIWMG